MASTPVLLPGKSHGQRSLVGYSLWGRKELDTTEWFRFASLQNFPQFIVIHTVKGFGIVDKEEIDVFLELTCFFDDPVDFGNLISGSSAFSKTNLNIWKFTVHVLLGLAWRILRNYFANIEMSAIVR